MQVEDEGPMANKGSSSAVVPSGQEGDSLGTRPHTSKRSGTSSLRRSKHGRTEPRSSGNVKSGGLNRKNNAAYLLWSGIDIPFGSPDDRAEYFSGLQKSINHVHTAGKPCGQQARTLLDLMTIRGFHSLALRQYSLGTALGFRSKDGEMTSIPAIIVFVARKVNAEWLHEHQILPSYVEGPGGLWCDIDIVEFTYFGVPGTTPKEQTYTELVDGLRGMDPYIGSGTQVASQETYGTLGAIVQSQIGSRQVGFITNRHVAVDLDYPSQKMYHPLPPNLGPGMYLGAVERATSFVKDDLWYGVFAGMNPETFVRADGAFIPFSDTFDVSKVITTLRGVGAVGEIMRVDLQADIGSIIGEQVVKVGRSSGVTKGVLMAYAVEYNDDKGVCFFTDLLIVGENKVMFDLEGDSGSLILLTFGEKTQKPRPVGLIWGGTANRGRLKLRDEHGPENWTSGVDLGRLLDILQLDILLTEEALQEAVAVQERTMGTLKLDISGMKEEFPIREEKVQPLETGDQADSCTPAAKDLLSLAFPLSGDNTKMTLDLAEEELSIRLSGPYMGTRKKAASTLPLLDMNNEKVSEDQHLPDGVDVEDVQFPQRRDKLIRKG